MMLKSKIVIYQKQRWTSKWKVKNYRVSSGTEKIWSLEDYSSQIRKLDTNAYSGAKSHPIPVESTHRFRLKVPPDSGGKSHLLAGAKRRDFILAWSGYFVYLFSHGTSFHIDFMGIMDQAVQDGISYCLIIYYFMPLCDWQLSGDYCWPQAISVFYQF